MVQEWSLFQRQPNRNAGRSMRLSVFYLLKNPSKHLRGCRLYHFALIYREDLNVILYQRLWIYPEKFLLLHSRH